MALFTSNRTLCEALGVHGLQLRDVTGFQYPYDLDTLHSRPVAKTVESGHTYLIVPLVKPDGLKAAYEKGNGMGPMIRIQTKDNTRTEYVATISLDTDKSKLRIGDEGIPSLAIMTIDEFKQNFFVAPLSTIGRDAQRFWDMRRRKGMSGSSVAAVAVAAAHVAQAASVFPPPPAARKANTQKPDGSTLKAEAIATAYADVMNANHARRVAQSAANRPDDLKRIPGITLLIEKRLNALGVTHFSQIAEWNTDDIKRIETALEYDGRILRQDWIGSATILTREDAVRESAQQADATGYGWPVEAKPTT